MGTKRDRYNRSYDFVVLDKSELQNISKLHFNNEDIQAEFLEGGFSNTNYLLKVDHEKYVLRIPQNSPSSFDKELSVIELVSDSVKAPNLLFEGVIRDFKYAILNFIPGISLSEIDKKTSNTKKIYFDVGTQLAKIHSFVFGKSGIFNEKFEFVEVFKNFGEGYLDYMLTCLESELAVNRMGRCLNEDVTKLIHRYSKQIINLKQTNHLIHCDFNGKNILVGEEEVNGVIDWEFAASGSPLVDFGNFLRFEDDHTEEEIESFVQGYYFGGGELPQNWRTISRIIDLGAMCEFIVRPQDSPLTTKTAINIFEKTTREL